jgi:oxidase EvaA
MYSNDRDLFIKQNEHMLQTRDVNFKEMAFERLYAEGSISTLKEVLAWYLNEKSKCTMDYSHIPLSDCKGWTINQDTGSFVHESGKFFRVDGIRVLNSLNREVAGGWDQPILTQVGYDGGILGLLRTRIEGVPHYLIESKSEPGNYGIVQISTTVQATFSNIEQAHKGKKTLFAEYFTDPIDNDGKVIFERWMSEDGGRLLNKRNKSMIVEVDYNSISLPNERFKWVTLWQLIELTRNHDAIIAPHIRGILSAV